MIEALVDRSQFPILGQKIYLASHSLGAMPESTREILQSYCASWATLGIMAWEGEWWQELWDFGRAIEQVLEAPADSVVPCLNVTLGFGAVASAMDYQERPKI